MRFVIVSLLFLISITAFARQVILVSLPSARLWAFENNKVVFKDIPVVIGKNGATHTKKEGDNKTPIGVFSIKAAFGFSKRPLNRHFPYFWIQKDTEAVDDVHSRYYNKIVNAHQIKNNDWRSSEKMHEIPQYKMGLIIDANPKSIRGKGSQIFMHIWRSPYHPTAGCIAMSSANMKRLILWLRKDEHPLVVITSG